MKPYSYQLAVLLLAAALPLGCLNAEPSPGGPGGPGKGPGPGPGDGKPHRERAEKMKDHAQEMKQELGLSEDQVAKISELMKANFEAMKAIRDDTSLSREQRKAKVQELRKSTDDKIDALLTPEQAAKRQELQKQRREKMKEKMEDRKEHKEAKQ